MLFSPNSRNYLLSLIAAFAFNVSAEAAPVKSELQQGIASYNASDNARACSSLQAHLAKNQNDAVAHYYLAHTLMKLGQTINAVSEYRKAYQVSNDSTMKQYCLQAIQLASSPRQTKNEPTKNPSLQKQDSDVEKSLDRIKRQSELAKDNKIRNGDADAKDKLTRGVHDVNQLMMERDMKIHNLLQPDAISITGRAIYLDHTAEIEQIKRDYENRIKEAQLLAKQEANFKKEEVAKDANKMVADVDNLRSQLTDTRHLPGTPALQATGTNFYTRQYGDPRRSAVKKPEPYVDELLATPEKMLLDAHTSGGGNKYRVVKEPVVGEQEKLKNHLPGTDLNVRGTLIKK